MNRRLRPSLPLLLLAPALAAQESDPPPSRAGARAVIPEAREVALARSAAPAAVSSEATVLVWNGADFDVAEEGSNGVTCYVGRSWPASLEPHCFDEEGSGTILPIHLYRTRRWHEGADDATIDTEIGRMLADGTFRLPSRPVLSYMMSAAQELISDQGEPAGAWMPHLMIYYPYLTQENTGLGPMVSTDAAVITDPGTPLSSVMIVVREAVSPEPRGGAPRTP